MAVLFGDAITFADSTPRNLTELLGWSKANEYLSVVLLRAKRNNVGTVYINRKEGQIFKHIGFIDGGEAYGIEVNAISSDVIYIQAAAGDTVYATVIT